MQQPLWPHVLKLPDVHPESQRFLHHPVMEAGKLLGKACFTDSLAVCCKAAYFFHSAVVPLLFCLHWRAFLLRISMPKMSEMTGSFYFIIYTFFFLIQWSPRCLKLFPCQYSPNPINLRFTRPFWKYKANPHRLPVSQSMMLIQGSPFKWGSHKQEARQRWPSCQPNVSVCTYSQYRTLLCFTQHLPE